jgi:N-acylneuraminate cytidylyltransferase
LWNYKYVISFAEVDVVALIQCTSPFLKASFLAEAYSKMMDGGYDSVFSVTRDYKLRWKELPDGGVEPLNFNPKRRPRRQDWDGELLENGMFYFATKNLINYGLLQGGRCGAVEIPKNYSIEIDTPFDLRVAEAEHDARLFL